MKDSAARNWSDIGYAYYKLSEQLDDPKWLEKALEACRKALTDDPAHSNAMVNMGLTIIAQERENSDDLKRKAAVE